jgi:hypothetical protein
MNLIAQIVATPLNVIVARVVMRGVLVWKLMLANVVMGMIAC